PAVTRDSGIHLLVTDGGFFPGKILLHRAFDQFGPDDWIFENFPGTFDCIPKRFRGSIIIEKSVATIAPRIVIFDNLLDSTGRARDRQGAVAQAIHGAQPTRLETRRNQSDVTASFNEMRQLLIVTFAIGKLRRILARGDGERDFETRI